MILQAIEDGGTEWFFSSYSRQSVSFWCSVAGLDLGQVKEEGSAERQGDGGENVKEITWRLMKISPAFVATRRTPSVSPVIDDITMNQSQNNGSTVLF
jgi:hypothetical protein